MAAHLGRSVRSVQRWERELGLPVHRIRTQAGEVIYARRGELDRWLESRQGDGATGADLNGDSGDAGNGAGAAESPEPLTAPQAAESVRRSRLFTRSLLTGGLLLLMVAVGGFGVSRGWPVAGAPAQPSSWAVEDGALAVRNSAGRLLWTHRFAFPLDGETMKASEYRYQNTAAEWVVLADLDHDGRTEVLAVPSGLQHRGALHCFESDGRLRFTHEFRRAVRFGEETFGPPFVTMPPFIDTRGNRTSIWAPSLHSMFFPAVIQKLTPGGQVVGEYWQAGRPGNLLAVERGGRRLLVLGGTRNEDFSAAVSVLDADNPTGTAPANLDKYRCFDCPPAAPLVFLSFPRLEIGRISGQRAAAREIWDVPGGLLVAIHYLPPEARDNPCVGSDALYRLDGGFRITGADFGDQHLNCHARLRLEGRLDHDFGPRDVAELFPVRAWYKGVLEVIDAPSAATPMPAEAGQEVPPPAGSARR